jgi:hypothetical protein
MYASINMRDLKTFKDLKFRPHPAGATGVQAKMFFPNGYGISVVRFEMAGLGIVDRFWCETFKASKESFNSYASLTNNEDEWEVAVLKGTEDEWNLCYSTPLTDDVIGHVNADMVTNIMGSIQNLETVK